jgi:hypothetical protein
MSRTSAPGRCLDPAVRPRRSLWLRCRFPPHSAQTAGSPPAVHRPTSTGPLLTATTADGHLLDRELDKHAAGLSANQNGGQLLPAAAKVFRVIASRHHCFIFPPIPTGARSFAAFGIPYLPSLLQGVLTEGRDDGRRLRLQRHQRRWQGSYIPADHSSTGCWIRLIFLFPWTRSRVQPGY